MSRKTAAGALALMAGAIILACLGCRRSECQAEAIWAACQRNPAAAKMALDYPHPLSEECVPHLRHEIRERF